MIEKLYQAKFGGSLSFKECQEINVELAELRVDEIPMEQHDNVRDYLINALNHNSVEPTLSEALDALLLKLQEIA